MGDYSPVLHIDNMSPKMILVLTLVFLIGGALSSALPSANPTDKNTEHVKNEDAENAGCKCIIEGSLVCHQIGTCFVECDSPCLDTEQIVFAGKNQCRSVSACKATKFEIVEPINHYLQNAVRGEVKTKNTDHLENEDVESLEFEFEDIKDEEIEDEEIRDTKDEENEDNEHEENDEDNEHEVAEDENNDEEHKDLAYTENEDRAHVENDVYDGEDVESTLSATESTTSATTTSTTESTTSTTTKSTTESTTRTITKSTASTTIGLPAGCKCIIEGSLVCHRIKTCFVECDSPCLDTEHVVFAGKRQCQSVSACAATKFDIVEPINHYLLG